MWNEEVVSFERRDWGKPHKTDWIIGLMYVFVYSLFNGAFSNSDFKR